MSEEEKKDNVNPYSGGSYSSSYSSGENNSSYGNSYRSTGAYNGGNPFTNSSYSYGQNGYDYSAGRQAGYGSYQYNKGDTIVPKEPPKKQHTFAKVVAVICVLALVAGGAGYGIYSFGNNIRGLNASVNVSNEAALPDNQPDEPQTDIGPDASEKEDTDSASEITMTTSTTAPMAVVTDVTAVVEEVMPAMVMIHNNYTASANFFGYVQTEEAQASGSGIIVGENDTELLIATNYHVVEGADSLEVIFIDDSDVEAVVKGADSGMDLAVIAVMKDDISSSTKSQIKIATIGDSDALQLGEPAIAIGNALGYGQSVTTGVISAINRDVEMSDGITQTFIQTDAAINPGNSGGALLNIKGEVIGINSNKIGGDTIEGMGYAIPVSVAEPIIDRLMNEETKVKLSETERGYIGISGISVTPDVSTAYGIPLGVYVAELQRGGGAEAAGIMKDDVITQFDGEEVTSMEDLQAKLAYYSSGTTVPITVKRKTGTEYEDITIDVTLGSLQNTDNG